MSFGFGVGDFLAVGIVIVDITASLSETGGARSEYQELIRELEALRKALQHIDTIQATSAASESLNSIKYAALSCRQPLEKFLGSIRKYERSLGLRPDSNSVLKVAADKLRWSFGKKDDIRRLQNYLSMHVGIINMLLAEYGLEKMEIAGNKAEIGNLHIRERLDNTRSIIGVVKDKIMAQTLVIGTVQSMLNDLFLVVSGEVRSSISSLLEMVVKVCVSTQQIYGVVLEIRGSLAAADTRWTFFQAPLIVEDAFGFKFPVPSEYDFDLLDTIIQHRFRHGEGSLDVKAGNYEVFKTKNSRDVLSSGVGLLPGTEVTMAILVLRSTPDEEKCPSCGLTTTPSMHRGGRTCDGCGLWFDQATKKRIGLQYLLAAIEGSLANESLGSRVGGVNQQTAVNFRNVRCAVEEDNAYITDNGKIISVGHLVQGTTLLSKADAQNRELPVLDEVLEYLDQIKVRLEPEAYNSFLDIMEGFKSRRLDTPAAMCHVAILLADLPTLLVGFNRFLPPGYTIHMPTAEHGIRLTTPTDTILDPSAYYDDYFLSLFPDPGFVTELDSEVEIKVKDNIPLAKKKRKQNNLDEFHSSQEVSSLRRSKRQKQMAL